MFPVLFILSAISANRYQTGLETTLGDQKLNTDQSPSNEDLDKLKKLMPMDIYLYEYIKQLFELRWKWYLKNVKLKGQDQGNVMPDFQLKMPEIIDGCRSTQFEIFCQGEVPFTGNLPDFDPNESKPTNVSEFERLLMEDDSDSKELTAVMTSVEHAPTTENFISVSPQDAFQTSEGNMLRSTQSPADMTTTTEEELTTPVSEKHFLILSPKQNSGKTIIAKTVLLEAVQPLQKWNPEEEVLAFIHIGKAGGTSFDLALLNSKVDDCHVMCVQSIVGLNAVKRRLVCSSIKPLICAKHFDWNLVAKGELNGYKMAPVILLRDPTMRAISEFYFRKTLHGSIGEKMRNQSLIEYLADKESMLQTRQIWSDGMVSTFNVEISDFSALNVHKMKSKFWQF